MSKRIVTPVQPTAADVRAFYSANPARVAKFKTDKARHTVAEGARGRLHPEVIADFNKGRKPERQYVLGRGKAVKAEAVALREQAVAMGAGRRGPLPKAVREALAQPKG
jgi:hypothetical protein